MRLQELFGETRKMPKEWAGINIKGLTADSRQVGPGFLFAALPGVTVDGARFIPQALEKGAAAVLAAQDADDIDAPLIRAKNPRRELALAAAAFYGNQPKTIAAVTGTNGKTSVASFLRQIWENSGLCAANLGTTGVHGPQGHTSLGLTTPGPVQLHQVLHDLAAQGVTHAALEASSHGLEQNRLDGVRISAAAFTNISRDHLDYHEGFEDYFAQKLRLFEELLPEGAPVVIDADAKGAMRVIAVAEQRGLKLLTVGREGKTLRLENVRQEGFWQHIRVQHIDGFESGTLPLTGDFQVSNALVAVGLAIACGLDAKTAFRQVANLKGACGRLEMVTRPGSSPPIFIDYAHTPDALETALNALKPYVKNNLVVVFGAGGDRDRGKRPLMGAVAAKHADKAIVTDDNPRGEDPGLIRSEILATCAGAIEIGDRGEAIKSAITGLDAGDVLLIAGKGHETGQIVGDEVLPFSDHEAVRAALAKGAAS